MGEFFGSALGITTGGHHDSIGIGAAGGPECLPGLGIGGGGDGAGVQDVNVGFTNVFNYPIAGLAKPAGKVAAVGLVELAAVGVNDDVSGAARRLNPG